MDLAMETMVKRGNEFADRWMPRLFNESKEGIGIINTSGPHWLEQRRFALHTLRNFGLGRSLMEDRIMMEFEYRTHLLDEQLQKEGADIDPQKFFELLVGSIINRMLFAERLEEQEEEQFFELKHKLDKLVEDFSIADSLVEFDIFWRFPPLRKRWEEIMEPQLKVKEFVRKQVLHRQLAIESGVHHIGEQPEDYVDAYLLKMREEKSLENSTYSIPNLLTNLVDLWAAGQETTTTTLLSGCYDLIHHPEVIQKLREELISVTMNHRNLSLQDKSKTPYFNAVLNEIQRSASILNFNLFRRTNGNTLVGDYIVPDKTPLTAEISVLMNDENHFKHPERFDPSRYFENNNLEQHIVPFGIGKRACLGESLARAELHLILGNLLLRYDIAQSEKANVRKIENNFGFFKRPPTYNIRITKLGPLI